MKIYLYEDLMQGIQKLKMYVCKKEKYYSYTCPQNTIYVFDLIEFFNIIDILQALPKCIIEKTC